METRQLIAMLDELDELLLDMAEYTNLNGDEDGNKWASEQWDRIQELKADLWLEEARNMKADLHECFEKLLPIKA